MSDAKCSALPWRVVESQETKGDKVPRVVAKDGGVAIMCINRFMGEPGPSKNEMANAQMIVRSVNSHAELVRLVTQAEAAPREGWTDKDWIRFQCEARAALKLARGEA